MFNRRVAVVDQEKCIGCKRCVSACPFDAIVINEETLKAEVIADKCRGCMRCAPACPVNTIKLR